MKMQFLAVASLAALAACGGGGNEAQDGAAGADSARGTIESTGVDAGSAATMPMDTSTASMPSAAGAAPGATTPMNTPADTGATTGDTMGTGAAPRP